MERAKRILCLALCFAMLAGYVPVPTHAEDLSQQGLCAHHPEHIGCSYTAAIEMVECSHQHEDACYIRNCVHVHGDCGYTAAVEGVPCNHQHDETCGYTAAVAEIPCSCEPEVKKVLTHAEECAYDSAVAESVCTCTPVETVLETVHTVDCSYAPAVSEVNCNHVHETCSFVEAKDEIPCDHDCTLDASCNEIILACSHNHDKSCGYTEAQDGVVCDFVCEECANAQLSVAAVEEHRYGTAYTPYTHTNDSSKPYSLVDGIYYSTNHTKNSVSSYTIAANFNITISLNYGVSSESGCDEFTIKHNETQLVCISGLDSGTLTLNLAQGDVLIFTYEKDDSESERDDRGWFEITSEDNYLNEELITPNCYGDVCCLDCGQILYERLPHNIVTVPAVEPTCTSEGKTAGQVCSECGLVTVAQEPVPMAAHSFVDGKCTICESVTYSEGITFTLSEDGTFYIVSGFGTFTGDNLIIPQSYNRLPVKEIGTSAFTDCTQITSVTIPTSITAIGYKAFYNCTGLKGVYISDLDTWCDISFDYESEWDEGLWVESYANPLKYAHNLYLNGEKVTDIVLSDAPSAFAFYGCNLNSATFTRQVGLNTGVFRGSSIRELSIPGGPSYLRPYSLYSCSNINGAFYLPASVTEVGDWTFWGPNIKVMYLEGSEIPARCDDLDYGNTGPFSGSSANVVYNCQLIQVDGNDYIIKDGEAWFVRCPKTHTGSIEILPTVTCNGQTYSVTKIGDYAFYNCDQVTGITIPNSITGIGQEAFFGCSSLRQVNITDIASWCNITFKYVSSNPLYYNCELYLDGALITDVRIPDSVTSINDYAFYGCDSLTSITMGSGVTSIGYKVFENCSALSSVILGSGLNSIGVYAFCNCTGLTNIMLPDTVTIIDSRAFENCTGLSSITIPGSVTNIGYGIFGGCLSLKNIRFKSDAPTFNQSSFDGLSATVAYPANNPTWTSDVMQNYGGTITWVAYDSCADGHTAMIDHKIAATCTTDGLTEGSHCSVCGEIIIAQEVIPAGHVVENGICTRCNVYGTCGDDLTWIFDKSTGMLTISGTGAMDDYSDGNQPWYLHQKNIIYLFIERNVTRVGDHAFSDCTGLIGELLIPDGVTDVGEYAFSGCTGLTSITLGKDLKQLDAGAFDNCTGVSTVTFTGATPPAIDCDFKTLSSSKVIFRVPGRSRDAYLEAINEKRGPGSGFQYVYTPLDKCGENLEWSFDKTTGSLTISGSGPMEDLLDVKEQPWYEYQSAITRLEIGEGVTTIGKLAFQNCSSLIGELSLPSSLTGIGSYAFSGCSGLSGKLHIPENVTVIDNGAFTGCTGLTGTLVIPDNVTSLGSSAFSGCSGLTGVDIGSGVKKIDYGTFSDCTGLTGTLVLPDTVTSIGSNIISGCTNLEGLVIGSGVKEIPTGAFFECSNLKSINLGKVTSIGYMVFYGCTGLQEITFQGNAPSIQDTNLFDGITATVYYPANDETWENIITQQYYGVITWVPYDVTVEPDPSEPIEPIEPTEPVFPMTGTVTTLLNVRSAPSQSADIVDKLQPGTKVEILRIETISDVEWGLIDTGWIMMHYVDLGDGSGTTDNTCGKDLIWSFDKDTGVLSISGTGAMTDFTVKQENPGYGLKPTDSPWLAIEDQVLEIVIKEGVTTIGTGAFANFENLRKVSLPDSLVSIGNHAFNTDTSLTELNIPDGVTYLGDFAFAVCVNLPSVTLPMGITRIGESVLDQCLALETLTIPANVTSIGYRALAYCTNLREVTFEGNAPSFDEAAFHGSDFTAYYQQKDPTWIPDVMQSYGGTVAWEAIYDTYTVTLDYQDPMVFNEIWEYTPGTTFALPTNVVRSGYIFLGWHEGDTKVTEIPADATGDKYYVAKWQEKAAISIDTTVQNYAYDGDGKAFVLKDTSGNLLPVAAGTDWLVPCSYMAVTAPFGERESAVTGASSFHQGIDLDTGTGWNVVASRAGTVVTAGWGDAAGNYVQINHGDGFSSIYMHLSSIGVSVGEHVSAGQYIGATGNTGDAADDHLHFGISLNGVYVNPESYVDLDGNDAKFFIDYTYSGVELNEDSLPYHPGIYGIRVTRPETATHKAVDLVINPAIRIVSNSGFCGYDLYWEFAPDSGILTISGNGSMYNYTADDPAPWNVYVSVIKEICFDSESMSIGDYAFADCTALTAVSIPDNVYRIGAEAFSGCTELNTITFTGDSPYTEENAFAGVTATAYYPAGWGWYEDDFADYGGKITWIETGVEAKKLTVSLPETMVPGMLSQGYVSIRPWNATGDIAVSVSNPDVLEFVSIKNDYIEIRALKAGTATVTVTEPTSGLKYSGKVTVVAPQPILVPCSMELEVPEGDSERFYSFTPETDGTYRFTLEEIEDKIISDGDYGASIYIIENDNWIYSDYWEGPQVIQTYLSAEKTYIIGIPVCRSAYDQLAVFTAEKVSNEIVEDTILRFYEEQEEVSFMPGDESWYYAHITYNGTNTLSWTSSNPAVMEVVKTNTSSCQYIIKGEGTAVITVSDGVLSDSLTITTKEIPFAELYMPITEKIETNYYQKDFGFIAPEAGRYAFTVTSDEARPSIGFNSSSDEADIMYSYGENSTTAFRTMEVGETCQFYVYGNESSYTIRISKAAAKPLSMKLIATEPYPGAIRFGAAFTPGNACDRVVSWEIDNRDIASETNNPDRFINDRNLMTYEIYSEGTLTVTAISESGLKASLTVSVQKSLCETGHSYGDWIHLQDAFGEKTGRERRTCIYCGAYQERRIPPLDEKAENRVILDSSDLAGHSSVWIDGVEYALQKHDDKCYVDLPNGNARSMVTYSYSSSSQYQYPVGMKVWMLENVDGVYTATRKEIFDDILQYSGMSIRVTGKKGIRMVTAIEKDKKNALVSGGLDGYTLKEYGTVVAWASKLANGNPLVLGQSYALSNYAYRKNVADPVFAYSGSLMQYTNVLVNFTDDQCKNELALRPYMILEDQNGETFTIYGGIVYRSIGYIAYQNRNTFEPGTAEYTYIWDIIHYVYGDVYDDEFVHSWSPIIK